MADQKNLKRAKNVFNTICIALDNKDWKYEKNEDDLVITLLVSGDDLPMGIIIAVDADRQLIRLLSPIPSKFTDELSYLGALACCHFTYKLADGSFDYNLTEGTVVFRITSTFIDSLISEELISYIIDTACSTIDEYNHHFEALAKGDMTLDELLQID